MPRNVLFSSWKAFVGAGGPRFQEGSCGARGRQEGGQDHRGGAGDQEQDRKVTCGHVRTPSWLLTNSGGLSSALVHWTFSCPKVFVVVVRRVPREVVASSCSKLAGGTRALNRRSARCRCLARRVRLSLQSQVCHTLFGWIHALCLLSTSGQAMKEASV